MRIAITIVLGVLPIAPLLVTWQRVRKDGSVKPVAPLLRIETVITTASFILLIAGLVWSPVLGPDYSRTHFAMIYTNLAILALICLAAFLGSARYRLPLGLASCILALEWFYLAVVSSVV